MVSVEKNACKSEKKGVEGREKKKIPPSRVEQVFNPASAGRCPLGHFVLPASVSGGTESALTGGLQTHFTK